MIPTVADIERLILDAPGLGLQVPAGSIPGAWREALDGYSYEALQRAMVTLSRKTDFLSIRALVDVAGPKADPDEQAWQRIAQILDTGRKLVPEDVSPRHLKVLSLRPFTFDYRESADPFRRKQLRADFLTMCKEYQDLPGGVGDALPELVTMTRREYLEDIERAKLQGATSALQPWSRVSH